jgi:hypothetical protein
LWFGLAIVLIMIGCGLLLAIPFSSGREHAAIRWSAVVAVIVQLFAFTIARLTREKSFFAGWITGAALRFVTLIGFALIGVKVLGMPAPAALISLVTFLFVSTLVEPKFLTS